MTLRPYQRDAVEWLAKHPKSYLADDPGLGKTRTLLTAAEFARTLVVLPAALRDIKVWETEAETINWNGELTTVSYHGLDRLMSKTKVGDYPVVIFDEAHKLKDRKVSWGAAATKAAAMADQVHLASGTPAPNIAVELYPQLRLIDPGEEPGQIPRSYWKWVREWFDVVPDQYTQFSIPGTLKACTPVCGRSEDCEHWAQFRDATYTNRLLRRIRDDVLTDLPPLTGADIPILVPMLTEQSVMYKDMRKKFLAEVGDGLIVEALNHSAQFQNLMKLSTGVSSMTERPEDDKYSGKLRYLEEVLPGRDRPVVVGAYYKGTAAAISRLADRLGLVYGLIGGTTPSKQRAAIVKAFQAGQLDVLIGSVSVIGEGMTLTAADEMILLERPWAPGQMDQLIRRLHRLGQLRPVTIRQLVTPGTADLKNQWNESLMHKTEHLRRVLTRRTLEDLV